MLQERFISFDGTRLSVYKEGLGRKTVFILNGLGGSTYSWENVWNLLRREYTFVAWDYRGLFGSERPADPKAITVTDNARDLLALMDDAGVEKSSLVSWSYGAQVALEAWRMAPERIEGIMFVNPVFGRPLEPLGVKRGAGLLLRLYAAAMKATEPITTRVVEQDWALWLGKVAGLLGPVDREQFVKVSRHFLTQEHWMYIRLMEEANRHDARDILPTLTVPVHVVLADHDPFVPLERTRKDASTIPSARITLLPDASHYTLMEYPEAIARLMKEFIDSLENEGEERISLHDRRGS